MVKLRIYHTIMYCKGFYKNANVSVEPKLENEEIQTGKVSKSFNERKRNKETIESLRKTLQADGYLVNEPNPLNTINKILLNELQKTGILVFNYVTLFMDSIEPLNTYKYWYIHNKSVVGNEDNSHVMDWDMNLAIMYLCISNLKLLDAGYINRENNKLDFKNVLPRKNGIKDKTLKEFNLI